jgi:hypothetical protein
MKEKIDAAARSALASPFSAPEEALKDVFA